MTIILRLTSKAEEEFFKMLEENIQVNLKDIYRRISRWKTYEMIKMIFDIQNKSGLQIIEKKSSFDEITKLPIVILERKSNISVEDGLIWID